MPPERKRASTASRATGGLPDTVPLHTASPSPSAYQRGESRGSGETIAAIAHVPLGAVADTSVPPRLVVSRMARLSSSTAVRQEPGGPTATTKWIIKRPPAVHHVGDVSRDR